MRLLYHLVTLGTTVHYIGLSYVPQCVSAFRLLLPLTCYGVSYWLFSRLVTSDPGVAERCEALREVEACRFCHRRQQKRTKHCRVCGVCIDGFDHHCDILDACIGVGNIGLFRNFLLFHCVFLLYAACHTWELTFECVKRDPIGMPLFVGMGVLEFSFGIAFAFFWLFHACLGTCDLRTYELLRRFSEIKGSSKEAVFGDKQA